jgi:deazaflavin-dependent oxidoreductase (nitroreductase family)
MNRNDQVIDGFRANNGRVGGAFQGARLLLMTTQGRRTGKPHTTPVVYLRDRARYLVFASNAGGLTDPDWYRNLLAHPQVTIELGTDAGAVRPYAATAVPLEGGERDRFWQLQCSIDPAFRDYERRTTRTIPVVALQPLDLGANPELASAMGQSLILAHDTLRAQLDGIRSQLSRILADDQSAELTDELHRSCLAYCYGLQIHHIREDGAFSALEDRFPELTPTLDHLRSDHRQVEKTLANFEALLGQGPAGNLSVARALGRAVDEVVAGLDDHFAYEEDHLLPALGVKPDRERGVA